MCHNIRVLYWILQSTLITHHLHKKWQIIIFSGTFIVWSDVQNWMKNLSTFQMSFLPPLYNIPEDGGSRSLCSVCIHPHGITFLTTMIVMFTAMTVSDLVHKFSLYSNEIKRFFAIRKVYIVNVIYLCLWSGGMIAELDFSPGISQTQICKFEELMLHKYAWHLLCWTFRFCYQMLPHITVTVLVLNSSLFQTTDGIMLLSLQLNMPDGHFTNLLWFTKLWITCKECLILFQINNCNISS